MEVKDPSLLLSTDQPQIKLLWNVTLSLLRNDTKSAFHLLDSSSDTLDHKNENMQPLASLKGVLLQQIRDSFVVRVLRRSYSKLKPDAAAEYLGMNTNDATDYLRTRGWILSETGYLLCPSNLTKQRQL